MPDNIVFSPSIYLTTINQSEESIFNDASSELKYHYGDVCYSDWKENYSSESWVLRKFIALPLALWSATIKVIYHLAKAIILGLFHAIYYKDWGKYFKIQCFNILRDYQESLGRILSIFYDRWGLYLIETSQFQKTCYDCSLLSTDYSTYENLSISNTPTLRMIKSKRNPRCKIFPIQIFKIK